MSVSAVNALLRIAGLEYVAEIQIDNGSSDLVWIPESSSPNTDIAVDIEYGIGSVQGNVTFVDVNVMGYPVKNQGMSASCTGVTSLSVSWQLSWRPFM